VKFVKVAKKIETEEVHAFRVTSHADLHEITEEGIVPFQEEVIYYICLC